MVTLLLDLLASYQKRRPEPIDSIDSAFTPPSPSLSRGDFFSIFLAVGWRRTRTPSTGSWLADRNTRHSSYPTKKKRKVQAVANQNEWNASFRRRARERISGHLCFYVSPVLRDGVNEDRHGRESKHTGGHLPGHMGPLPRLVSILIPLVSLLKGA